MLRHLLNSYKPRNPHQYGHIATYFAVVPQRTSVQTPTRQLVDMCDLCLVHITPDYVVGSFVVLCEPQAAKLWNYCPYFEW